MRASPAAGVIYISDGYPLDLNALGEGPALARLAALTGIVVFAIEGRAFADADPPLPMPGMDDYPAAARTRLRTIAEPTGGFAFVGSLDVPAALERIGAAMR